MTYIKIYLTDLIHFYIAITKFDINATYKLKDA